MSFIDEIKNKAKKDIKTIVLPEANDLRTIEATANVLKEGFANIVLIGNENEIRNLAKDNYFDISKAKIINPKNSEKYNTYVEKFYELRKEHCAFFIVKYPFSIVIRTNVWYNEIAGGINESRKIRKKY